MSTLADPLVTAGLRRLPVDADEGFPQSFLLALRSSRTASSSTSTCPSTCCRPAQRPAT